jgi:hypothetical protein
MDGGPDTVSLLIDDPNELENPKHVDKGELSSSVF